MLPATLHSASVRPNRRPSLRIAAGLCAAVLLTAALPALAADLAPVQESPSCLPVNAIDSFSYVDRQTIRAVTRDGTAYSVTLGNRCGYRKTNVTLIYDPARLGTCLDHGDVVYAEDGSACFVDTVAVAPAPAG